MPSPSNRCLVSDRCDDNVLTELGRQSQIFTYMSAAALGCFPWSTSFRFSHSSLCDRLPERALPG